MNEPSTSPPLDTAIVDTAHLHVAAVYSAKKYATARQRPWHSDLVASVWALCRLTLHFVARTFGLLGARIMPDLYRSLHGRHDWRGNPFRRRVMMVKYVARVLSMPREHARYLAFIQADPVMHAYRCRDPRLLERHLHRYVSNDWDRAVRLRSIRNHYQFAREMFPAWLFKAIYGDGHAALGNLVLKDNSMVKLCLRPPMPHGCEGELCIQLSNMQDHPIYRVVMSVIDGAPTLAIGCIQGPDGASAKELVRDLTKNMYGLRPKQLMLALVYVFARHYGIRHVLAVANASHPLRRNRAQFQSDYDAFWMEQNGRATDNGWFKLPEEIQRKSEADVPSNHRSAFRRREALRVDAERLLLSALGDISSGAGMSTAEDDLSVRLAT